MQDDAYFLRVLYIINVCHVNRDYKARICLKEGIIRIADACYIGNIDLVPIDIIPLSQSSKDSIFVCLEIDNEIWLRDVQEVV